MTNKHQPEDYTRFFGKLPECSTLIYNLVLSEIMVI